MSEPLNQVELGELECIDFISDLHLQPSEASTFEAWARYMHATPAKALFILGDFFEVWAGDDYLEDSQASFERECLQIIKTLSLRASVYFMAGNRDFLLGARALGVASVQVLHDPCVLQAQGQRFALSHGDAMCLSDTEYLKFRRMVRDPLWQAQFLSRPLGERLATARAVRVRSEQEKAKQRSAHLSKDPADSTVTSHEGLHDVDALCAASVLESLDCKTLIHGHTHQAGEYPLLSNKSRVVLSDWDADASPARLEVLRLESGVLSRHKLR